MDLVRFLIVDDHPTVRAGIQRVLETAFPGAAFASAGTEAEALRLVESGAWSVVILDINLPGRDGFEVLRAIKDRSPSVPVLIHSMYREDQFGVRALRGGADGFITKDRPVTELLAAVHKLLNGKRYVGPNLAEALAASVAKGAFGDYAQLSDREHQVLRCIASGQTPTQISKGLNLSVKTVSTYRTRILEKLNLKTTAELIRFGIENKII